jgi:hypothetical protein
VSSASKALAYLKRRLADTDGGFLTDVEVDREKLRSVVERLEMLEPVAKTAPFEVGDIVRAVGEEEPTGRVIQIKHEAEGYFETAYLVKLYKPTLHSNSISYYQDEIELMERPK